MKRWMMGALVAVALASVTTGAFAQADAPEKPWAVRIGALWPTNGTVRSNTHRVWFDAGLDRVVSRTQDGNDWVASVDFGSAKNVNYWALQGLFKWNNSETTTMSKNFGFGVGAGVYFFDPKYGKNQTEFGIPVVVDWNLSRQLFLESKYHWVVSDTQVSSLSAQLGYKF